MRIGSQRGIAWRCADSLSLREFLGLDVTDSSPDHSSLTKVRQRLPLEAHAEVFELVLQIAVEKKLLKGKRVAVDATTLEANAAMKSIVRRDTGEDWKQYLRRLMEEEGLLDKEDEPTDEALRRFDKQRKNKKVSNDEWTSPTDPESRIAKLKDGRIHLAYKAENVVDLDTDLVLAAQLDLRTYIPEPKQRRPRRWTDKPADQQRVVDNNRRRTRRNKGRRIQRRRSELVERTFAHMCQTGGARRTWLRGLVKVRKRWLIQAAARNVGLILHKQLGIGTARSLQDAWVFTLRLYLAWLTLSRTLARHRASLQRAANQSLPHPASTPTTAHRPGAHQLGTLSTGC